MNAPTRGFAILVVALVAAGCGQPDLDAVVPARGYPRQLLAVQGDTVLASVVWNAGTADEKQLYNGLFGTQYFQIPDDAKPGTYNVALRNADGTSPSVTVEVLARPKAFPPPRIEDIGVLAVAGTGPVDLALTVAAANLDVDATVSVTETVGAAPPSAKAVSETVRWGGLPVDYLQDHQPETFGYPVYHYLQLVSVVPQISLGATLLVTVTNTDGQQASREYKLPSSLSDLDSDGDGLLDAWEGGSYTAPSGGVVPLSQMGTRKWRKDVLVEVDWIAAAQPDPDVFTRVREAFAAAPILNPDGSSGINLIVDHGPGSLGGAVATGGGETLADHDLIEFSRTTPASGTPVTDFFAYKNAHFNGDRLLLFHYAIYGRANPGGTTGRGEVHGNDFYVTLVDQPVLNTVDGQTGLFVHELGHNLGLTHGNLNHPNPQAHVFFKPNLPSVMNFRYTTAGVDASCDLKPDGILTYSQGTLKQIVESTVDETLGICDDTPVDMDPPSGISVGVDINLDGDKQDVWDDFDQWGNLLLDFDAPGSQWNNN